MKTIQEYLKNCNRESIINTYLYKHAFYPMDMLKAKASKQTIGERTDAIKAKLNKMIDKLISIEPIPQDDRWILLVHHTTEYNDDDLAYNLYKESELDGDGFKTPYGYEFTPFEEAAGFYVADTYLTQYEIESLLVNFLYEVSWTGYDQEHLEDEVNKLKESAKEADEHRDDPDYFISAEEFFERLKDELGFEPEKKDPRQEEAWGKLMKAQIEYNTLCQKIEIDKLKELLAKEKNDQNVAEVNADSQPGK